MKKIIFLAIAAPLMTVIAKAQEFKFEGTNFKIESRYQQKEIKVPDVSAEGSTRVIGKIGFWGKVAYSQPILPKKLVEKGYPKENGLNGYSGFFYSDNGLEFMAGAGLELTKKFWGPTLGISISKKNFSFSAMGIYSVECAYNRSEQSIEGYDPNSWYKAQIIFKAKKNFGIGLTSQRFYSTGIMSEFEPCCGVKFWGILGRDLESKTNSIRFGIGVNI